MVEILSSMISSKLLKTPIQRFFYLVELFEGGKMDKNHRVSPEVAELKLRDKFPSSEDCWLTLFLFLPGVGGDRFAKCFLNINI